MADRYDGLALFPGQLPEYVKYDAGIAGVRVYLGFVPHDHNRIDDHGTGNGLPLLLAFGEVIFTWLPISNLSSSARLGSR